jgi:hypothetical protein
VVIRERFTEALRDGEESARLRREISLLSVGSANDKRKSCERRIGGCQVVFADDRIEAALVAVMPELHIRDVIGCCTLAVRDVEHLIRRGVKELRFRIHEALDEPGTGNTIDFRPFTSDPLHL